MHRCLPSPAAFLRVSLAAVMLLGLGCDSCPDLWLQAFEVELVGADPGHVLLTAVERNTGEVPCSERALAENCTAGAGVYDLSFELSGVVIGEVPEVCTLGYLSDCDAEEAEEKGPPPHIRLIRDGSGLWSATLDQQGVCP